MKAIKRTIQISISSLLAVFLMLFLFPKIIFGNKLEYKSFTIYSHLHPDKNIFTILDSVENLINSSELHKSKTTEYKIYLCNNFSEFSLFAITQRHSFAFNNPLTNNIFISKSDILQNTVQRNGNENNLRTLSGTIAHEITHTLIKDEFGFVKYILLDTWKDEGYSDFIAKESSFDYKKVMMLLCNSENPSSPSFKYFKYRFCIEFLIRETHLSIVKIVNDNFNLEELDKEIQKRYCR
jgi:hypothetical protein